MHQLINIFKSSKTLYLYFKILLEKLYKLVLYFYDTNSHKSSIKEVLAHLSKYKDIYIKTGRNSFETAS